MVSKVLTVKNPWATFIIKGIKDVENRLWKTSYRGRLLIHSSAKSEMSVIFTKEIVRELGKHPYLPLSVGDYINGCIIGCVDLTDCVVGYPSIWAEKSDEITIYNWVLENPVEFEKPIPCKGKLGLWTLSNDDIKKIENG
jgi:hypothetical protein